ncbi:MAG: amino acid racemase [Bacteroidales bacterium]|nr:amino acid racemase [Bacteroidales bacterium]
MEKEKIILGIFGGMGPEATADLYKQIIELTPAEKDQDHIPTLIYSLPQVPERTASIRNQDTSIIPFIVEGVTRLEKAGASFIAIPCNTVHYYYDQMQDAVSIPIIHMIRETVNEVRMLFPDAGNVGLLATTGTIESGLYEKELIKNGFKVIIPDDNIEKDKVMKAVFGIKAGTEKIINEDLLAEAGQHLIDKGAEVIILGCTEIPLAFNPSRVDVPVVSATRVLAESAIKMYQELRKKTL